MGRYFATAEWTLEDGGDFPRGRYSRGHSLVFGSGVSVPGTASHQIVGNKWAAPDAVDPEEMLVGAINTCHMLSFLHVAREAGFVVTRYRDAAVGVMNDTQGALLIVRACSSFCNIAYSIRTVPPGSI